MIEKIPNISINNSGGKGQRPLFNGYIYSLDYGISTGDGLSSIVVNLVSEDGTYSITKRDLNLSRVYNISIGSKLTVPMYLKRFKKNISASGNILELEFVDGSFILDRTLVGLHKRFGNHPLHPDEKFKVFGNKLSEKHLIIVGREFHPCDTDYDGNIDDIKEISDPCHPCNKDAEKAAERILVDCEEMAKYEILEVKYNFSDLINGMNRAGIKTKNNKDPNPKYFANYEGTLREVLSSWCSDFGWTFVWEKNTVVFIDLRRVGNINTTISRFCPNLEEYVEEHTLDGTIQTATITNYNRQGEASNAVRCQDAVYISIPPYNKNNAPIPNLTIDQGIDETAASFGYYSSELRNLWYYFNHYQIRNSSEIVPGKKLNKLGIDILSRPIKLANVPSPNGSILSPTEKTTTLDSPLLKRHLEVMGNENMESVSFLEADLGYDSRLENIQDLILDDEIFRECFSMMAEEEQWKAVENIDKKYFFVGYYNPNIEEQHIEEESNFASGFLNKYRIFMPNMADPKQREFFEDFNFIKDDETCNSEKRYKQDGKVSFELVGDPNGTSFQYYNNPGIGEDGAIETLGDLPFREFLKVFKDRKVENINSSGMVRDFKLVLLSGGSGNWFPERGLRDPESKDNKPVHPINDSKLIECVSSYLPRILQESSNESGENMARVILEEQGLPLADLDRGKVCIFMGTEVDDTEFVVSEINAVNPTVQVGVPFNGVPLNPNNDTNPDARHRVIYQYPELKCLPMGCFANTCIRLDLATPCGNFYLYQPGNALYNIVIQKTRETTKLIPKIESVYVDVDPPADTVLEYGLNYRNISDADIKLLTKDNVTSTCLYDEKLVKKVHEEAIKNLKITQNDPLSKLTFTVAGIDISSSYSPSIEDGLLSISISLGEDGVKTAYEFGTIKMVKPGKPEVYSQLEKNSKISTPSSLTTSVKRNDSI